MKTQFLLACALVVGSGVTGCGRRGPAVEMVEGRVLLDGEPLAGATIGFAPILPESGLNAVGLTEEDGAFRLTAMRGGAPKAGTAVGDYTVIVSKMVNVDPNSPPPKPRPGALVPKLVKYSGLDAPPPYIIYVPEAYGNVSTSGLTATVQKGHNTFTFELRSDYQPKAAK